ncbi:Beta-barrel assembly machine subunit BamA [Pelosinus fermentans]|uniref:BamA/OMP85 family outer membrane protein n=1 Tax=Pelosinus fermentans TaxID=365349 RepID=UPI0002685A54|nr:BamA/TamA family outer membrane protein [Pelosinus fermentans]OAM92722.1 surface antigen (D15) [Pelosinus fermentans DSM 17108]SDQ54855.1 Beta-barrel assembly machine subunit BamA [Pelosinus fermentans]
MKIQKNYKHILLAAIFSISLIFSVSAPAYAADPTGKTVTSITVTGNTTVPEATIMEAVKLKPGEALTADKVKQDMQAIYELGTFFDVVSNFNEVPEGVQVVYTVMENPVLQEIIIKGNTKVSSDKLSSMLTVKTGSILNSKALNENVRSIEEYYHDQGYILTKVSDVAMGTGGVLTITINEGMLEGIEVKGNEKTQTHVITREMKLKPNQPFNVKDAKRSMQKVYNLGYFEDVNMKLNPGKEPNAIVLETTVVEQKTGRFSIGGGYSKNDGMIGIIELGDDNFRGTGDKVKLHWEFGGSASNKNYEVSYTRPWLDDKQTSLGFSFYDMTNEYTDYDDDGHETASYDKRRKGFDLTLGRPQGEYVQNYVTLKQRKDQYVEWVSGDNYETDQDYIDRNYLENNFGTTRSISLMRVYDSRDNVFSPTEGNRVALTAEFAGKALGGDFNFNKYTAETRNYLKVGHAQIVALRGTVGYADGKMPDSQRFAVGGSDSLRGYRDDQFKGNKMLAATAEYRFPIAKKVEGVAFTDIGKAWSGEGYKLNDLEASVGVGIRVSTPIGPIRLDYAQGSQGGRSHFSFGGQF